MQNTILSAEVKTILQRVARQLYLHKDRYTFYNPASGDYEETLSAPDDFAADLVERFEFELHRNASRLFVPSEVDIMELSAETLRLAYQYVAVVAQYDDPTAYRESGYTPQEMERRRKLAHDRLLTALAAEHIDVSDRASTTELARRIDQWLRE